MKQLFAMARYDKKLLFFFIVLIFNVVLDFGICVFDIVEFIVIKGNTALLSPAFVWLNIVLLLTILIDIVSILIFLAKRKKR